MVKEQGDALPPADKYPTQLDYLYRIFCELSRSREYDDHGFARCLSFVEIKAYLELIGVTLASEELQAIFHLDYAWTHQFNKERANERQRQAAN